MQDFVEHRKSIRYLRNDWNDMVPSYTLCTFPCSYSEKSFQPFAGCIGCMAKLTVSPGINCYVAVKRRRRRHNENMGHARHERRFLPVLHEPDNISGAPGPPARKDLPPLKQHRLASLLQIDGQPSDIVEHLMVRLHDDDVRGGHGLAGFQVRMRLAVHQSVIDAGGRIVFVRHCVALQEIIQAEPGGVLPLLRLLALLQKGVAWSALRIAVTELRDSCPQLVEARIQIMRRLAALVPPEECAGSADLVQIILMLPLQDGVGVRAAPGMRGHGAV
ncbi:hypothetical protein D3C71_1258190 [compost metagenome]